MKILYYCMGGGLGHLTRLLAYCHTFNIRPAVITNCAAAKDQIQNIGITDFFSPTACDQKSKQSLRKYVGEIMRYYNPSQLIIDAFPGGILGELAGMTELRELNCTYLMRILKHKKYMLRVSDDLPFFNQIFVLENLLPEQDKWLESQSGCSIEKLELCDPDFGSLPDGLPEKYWLIVHSNNDQELEELYKFALQTAEINRKSPEFVVVCPSPRPAFLPGRVLHFDSCPAGRFFINAEKIFSGAGFNMVRQLRNTCKDFYLLPFNRALDDQFFRAAEVSESNKIKTF